MLMKKHHTTSSVLNKRARFDYELKDSYVAGIALNGAEVKSLRRRHASLNGAYVTLKDNEAWLVNCLVTPIATNAQNLPAEAQNRNRKLLLKKKELEHLHAARQQGLTIIPVKLLTNGHHIKIEIATARGKREYDKRETLKKRDQERNLRNGL